MNTRNPFRRHLAPLLFVALAAFSLGSIAAEAQTPAPVAPVVTQPAAVVAAPVATLPAPVAPAPVAPVVHPAAVLPKRKENGEPEEAPAAPAAIAATNPAPSIFDRVAAMIGSNTQVAARIAAAERKAADLAAQLATANATIDAQTTELANLRAGKAQLENALSAAEAGSRTVAETVAGLGFPAAKLPGAAALEVAEENTVEGLEAQLKGATDPKAKHAIAQKLRAAREAAKKA